MVVRTAVRLMRAKKPKPKMKPIELNNTQQPDHTPTITRTIFDLLKDHGPLSISQTWDKLQGKVSTSCASDPQTSSRREPFGIKEVGLKELTSKSQMKTVMRWMRERQKIKLICNHVGSQKQFLYTTWFTKANTNQYKPNNYSSNE